MQCKLGAAGVTRKKIVCTKIGKTIKKLICRVEGRIVAPCPGKSIWDLSLALWFVVEALPWWGSGTVQGPGCTTDGQLLGKPRRGIATPKV